MVINVGGLNPNTADSVKINNAAKAKAGAADASIKGLKFKDKLGGKIGDAVEFAKDKGSKIKDKLKSKSLISKLKDGVKNLAGKVKTAASGKKGKLALLAVAGGVVGLAAKAIIDKIAGKNEDANIQTEEYEVVE